MIKAITDSPQGKLKTDINPPVIKDFNSRRNRKLSSTVGCRPDEGQEEPELRTLSRMPDLIDHWKTGLMNDQKNSMDHCLPAHQRRGGKVSSENSANVRYP